MTAIDRNIKWRSIAQSLAVDCSMCDLLSRHEAATFSVGFQVFLLYIYNFLHITNGSTHPMLYI